MKHGKSFNHLGRDRGHRGALLKNLVKSIILKKRVFTTLAKAKAVRGKVERIVNMSKSDSTHIRRVVFSKLQDKEVVKELFNEVSGVVAGRNGGYTRIVKLGNRFGDNAQMCMIELVDFNDIYKRKSG